GWAAYWQTYSSLNHATVKFDWTTPVFNNPTASGTGFVVGNGGFPAATTNSYYPTLAFQVAPSITTCDYHILQSPHTGVLLAGLGDGSVRTVGSGLSPTTWNLACNPSDGAPLPSDW